MSMKMIVSDRRFWPLFWTQFFGALNDNVFKNALVIMITFRNVTIFGLDKAQVVALSGGIFILPFFLFSPLAGQISDKLEKSRLVRLTKLWEVLIMLIAGLGFFFHAFDWLLLVLFMAGIQAALFGPVKYSLIPDLVRPEELIEANAYVEMGTFLAILLGTIGGGLLVELPGAESWIAGTLLLFALFGTLTSFFVTRVEPAAPSLKIQFNPLPNFTSLWSLIRERKSIFNSVLGISWFWFFGAAILSILPVYCKDFLNVDEHVVTCFLAMFTIGIGTGSVLCEKLSFGRVELGLVPIGSLGMSIFLIDLCLCHPTWPIGVVGAGAGAAQDTLTFSAFLDSGVGPRMLFDFFVMSTFGGFFILPLYTLIQERSRIAQRSRVIAANNILNAVFMVVASLLVMGFHAFHFSYPQMFLTLALLNLLAAVYIYTVVPEFTLRFIAWVIARCIYLIRPQGEDHIPKSGGALLVCNHISFVDWLIILATVKRPVRFVIYYKFFEIPGAHLLMKHAKVIPISSPKEDMRLLREAFERIAHELEKGELVCIFPEGELTHTGEMSPFRNGLERILERTPVPVIPMALTGLWGTFFTHGGGLFKRKWPKHWLTRVHLVVGQPVPPEKAKAGHLFEIVKALRDS